MSFRDREKSRLVPIKDRLFSAPACRPGQYRKKRYAFCLHEAHGSENLYAKIRPAALQYFRDRRIPWHDGKDGNPSNHLCCSQSCCVNIWFPFVYAPRELAEVLRGLGYDVAEMLPIYSDALPSDEQPFVAFEWIGEKNYLGELRGGHVALDDGRSRGARFTSLDFLFRFRRGDGRIQIVAGEWKYSEYYANRVNLRYSKSGTDRFRIYGPHITREGSQITAKAPAEALFFDPFDQMMRQQLLCSAMEREGEMGADVVSLLHVAPKANRDLMKRVTSPGLATFGSDVHTIWDALTSADRFKGLFLEDLLPVVCANAPAKYPKIAEYLDLRYGQIAH